MNERLKVKRMVHTKEVASKIFLQLWNHRGIKEMSINLCTESKMNMYRINVVSTSIT